MDGKPQGTDVVVDDGSVVDEVEIEVYGRRNERPPRAKRYLVRIDKQKYVVHKAHVTGRELLTLAGKTPVEHFKLFQKLCGGQLKEVGPDECVDLGAPGIENFKTVPLKETEG